MHDLKIFRALFSDSIYVSETPNGIVYAMTLSTILKLYLLRYTPLANFPLLGGQRFVFGRDGL